MNLQALVDLLRPHGLLVTTPDADPVVGDLAVDSREVTQGALFLALPGSVADGHDFIGQAVAAGAAAVLAERPASAGVPVILVRDARTAAEVLAAAWYHHPLKSLEVVGITGTNGKTTTTALMRHLLGAAGDAGSIGTLGAFDGAGDRVPSTAGALTTPGPLDLQRTFRSMVDRGVHRVAMEASSHALHQGRLDAIAFAAGVFTNLTREHLDYHGTLEAYLEAKLRLSGLVRDDGTLSVNADDPGWTPLLADPRTITWGHAPDAALRIAEVHHLTAGSRVTFDGRFGRVEFGLPIPGEFNVANAAAAAAAALGMGMALADVAARLDEAPQVPGRMERLIDAPFHVIRDYAHTPDAVERLLVTIRAITPGRIFLVFGCGGDRDPGKRSIMGEVAATHADLTILTADNPRTEDPERIIDDIAERMPKARYQREVDRYVAIATALGQAGPGDTVVLMGKGHENYQIIGETKEPFDEREIVRALMGQ